jgi:hypothetical protein
VHCYLDVHVCISVLICIYSTSFLIWFLKSVHVRCYCMIYKAEKYNLLSLDYWTTYCLGQGTYIQGISNHSIATTRKTVRRSGNDRLWRVSDWRWRHWVWSCSWLRKSRYVVCFERGTRKNCVYIMITI